MKWHLRVEKAVKNTTSARVDDGMTSLFLPRHVWHQCFL